MSVEEKFKAAVNVIRSLPKSGSYQPSNELMLRFYSHFKQATEGPCDKAKPGFWDVINRAKWEAWHKLGNMAREEAMEAYVNDLYKIVETMSLSEDVVSFLQASGSGYDVSADDLELVAGDVLERVRSRHTTPAGSPEASRASSPITTQHRTHPTSVSSAQSVPESEDEYIDTIEDDTEAAAGQNRHKQIGNGHIAHNGRSSRYNTQLRTKALEEVPAMLLRLEQDVAALRRAVETQNSLLKNSRPRYPSWWPFMSISPALAAVLVFWPILAVRIDRAMTRRNN